MFSLPRWVGGFPVGFVTACAGGAVDLQPPPLRDAYSHYLARHAGRPQTLHACELAAIDLGRTEPAPLRRLKLQLSLPIDFTPGPRDLLIDSLIHPAFPHRWGANQWLPGVYIQPTWYRWTRVESGSSADVDAPSTLLQLVRTRATRSFRPRPPGPSV